MAFLQDNKRGVFVPRHLQRPAMPVVKLPLPIARADKVKPKLIRAVNDDKISKLRPMLPDDPVPVPVRAEPDLKSVNKGGRPRKVLGKIVMQFNPSPFTKSYLKSVQTAKAEGREMAPIEPFVANEIVVAPGESIELAIEDRPRIRSVMAATLSASGMNHPLLVGASRAHDVVAWRMASIIVARRLTGQSLPVIGQHYQRDHTTVLHAVRCIDRPTVSLCIKEILSRLTKWRSKMRTPCRLFEVVDSLNFHVLGHASICLKIAAIQLRRDGKVSDEIRDEVELEAFMSGSPHTAELAAELLTMMGPRK